MNTKKQFFSLNPDKGLYNFLKNCKKIALNLAGTQKYLLDEPHLTLYAGKFLEIEKLIKDIDDNFRFQKLEIKLDGWKTFYDDPVTGGHTLVVGIAEESLKILRDLQIRLINIANKYRSKNILAMYKALYNTSEPIKNSLSLYGFPFVGEIWEGHFTIASFEKSCFDKIYKKLKRFKMPEKTVIDRMNFHSIEKEGFKLIKSWTFE